LTRKLIKLRLVTSFLLAFGFSSFITPNAYADESSNLTQALATAATEVQQAVDAANVAAQTIETATVQAQEANATAPTIVQLTESATASVAVVNENVATLMAVSQENQTITVNSETVTATTNAVATAQQVVQMLDSAIVTAQTELQQAVAARTAVDTATANANTQFVQANAAIAQAQAAVTALQATISTTRSVLANTDDAGILMTLPFGMLMGNTLYNNVYVGSNAVITFGTDQGYYYWTTPTVPEISVGGLDWTTWSQGSGITYSTTPTSLAIAWDVRVFPTTDHSIQMTQLRFNADVNPTSGAWVAEVTGVGPYVDQARWNYRETNNGTITQITDVDTSGVNQFRGNISQGNYVAPVVQVDTSTSLVQQQIDSATVTIQELNITISQVVSQNQINSSNVSSIPSTSNTSSTLTSATNTSNQLKVTIASQTETITAIVALLPQENTQTETVASPPPPVVYIYYVEPVVQEPATQEESTQQPEQPVEPEQPEQPAEPEQPTETDQPEQTEDVVDQPTSEDTSQEDTTQEQPSKEESVKDLLAEAEKSGEPVTAEALKDAGLEYKDLPPATPVEVRVDVKGNPVIITAEVASALEAFTSPQEFVNAITGCLIPEDQKDPNDPQKCEIFTALANIGADMSPAEREKAQDIVVVTILAGQMVIGNIMKRRMK